MPEINEQRKQIIEQAQTKLRQQMPAEEIYCILSMSDYDFVKWLITIYEDELKSYTDYLAKKFYWLEERYGDSVCAYLLLEYCKANFLNKAHKYANYKQPVSAMKRTMNNMMNDIAKWLKRNYGHVRSDTSDVIGNAINPLPLVHARLEEYERINNASYADVPDLHLAVSTIPQRAEAPSRQEKVVTLVMEQHPYMVARARKKAPAGHVVRYRYCRQEYTIPDIVQESITRLLAYKDNVPCDKDDFKAYLSTVMRSCIATPVMEHKKHLKTLIVNGLEDPKAFVPDDNTTIMPKDQKEPKNGTKAPDIEQKEFRSKRYDGDSFSHRPEIPGERLEREDAIAFVRSECYRVVNEVADPRTHQKWRAVLAHRLDDLTQEEAADAYGINRSVLAHAVKDLLVYLKERLPHLQELLC